MTGEDLNWFQIAVRVLFLAAVAAGGVTPVLGIEMWPSGVCFALCAFVTVTILQEFVRAATALGATPLRIMRVHLLPNMASPIIVATMSVTVPLLFHMPLMPHISCQH